MSIFKFLINKNDAPEAWQFGFQDPATPMAEGMISFHHYLMFFVIVIGIIVCWLLYKAVTLFNIDVHPTPQKFTHSSALEIIWTVIPAIILLIIAAPSFSLLYSLDETIDPDLTLKIVGHQWYWSYEYSDPIILEDENSTEVPGDIAFDSYLIQEADLELGQLRLLEVDNRVILPIDTHIRIIVTSTDVLHCWAIPSFGIKLDACPGRLNQTSLYIKRQGTYYGQCSEICGINHGFMPIVIEGVSLKQYTSWISEKI